MLPLLLALCAAPAPDFSAEAPTYGPALPPDGRLRIETKVHHSLEATLVDALGPSQGLPLSQVAKRLVVWMMDPRRDLRAGDRLMIEYAPAVEPKEPVIHALRLTSQKHERSFSSLRYQPKGASWPRYYGPEGRELEARLVDGPMESYEQVTSLLGDGRRHKGVDFKAPVGTPIKAPFAGTVTRRNWSTRSNGRCVELVAAGRDMKAYFLHLSRIDVKPGQRVEAGAQLGLSGNTGRSTAPHLHYQLERTNGRLLDPFKVHETRRRRLPEAEMPAFRSAWSGSFDEEIADAGP